MITPSVISIVNKSYATFQEKKKFSLEFLVSRNNFFLSLARHLTPIEFQKEEGGTLLSWRLSTLRMYVYIRIHT